MQIRCQNCHKPFGLGKEAVHAALDQMTAENLHHYDAPCPHCRRVNHVSKADLLRAAPDWGKAEKTDQPAS
jgi:phage FluMu protein Com